MAYWRYPMIAIAVAGSAAAQPAERGPMQMDVAGVRLEMTPEQAKVALQGAGYRITGENTGNSFEQAVRREADQQLGRPTNAPRGAGTDGITARGPNRETAEVRFVQRPGRSAVSAVTLTVPKDVITVADFNAQVVRKYGKPGLVKANGAELHWCAAVVGTNCGRDAVASGPHWADYPDLRAEAYAINDRMLWLTLGEVAHRDLRREFAVAVDALAPKKARVAL